MSESKPKLSKAQTAALSYIQTQVDELLKCVEDDHYRSQLHGTLNIRGLAAKLSDEVKRFNLNEQILTDALDQVYQTLITKNRFYEAADLAKEYRL